MSNINLKNQINPIDCIKIIFLAIFTNLFAEFLTWMFIYRTKKYRETKKQIDMLKKKIELNKESIKGKNKQLDKKVKKQENDLKYLNFTMMLTKMVSMFIIGYLQFFLFLYFMVFFKELLFQNYHLFLLDY